MTGIARELVLAALARLLRPIAGVLVRGGVSYDQFTAVARWVFVDVASAEFSVRNRPANVSRVAALTGLSRKEITRNRSLPLKSAIATAKPIPLDAVVDRWTVALGYCDEHGDPLELPMQGSPSFKELVDGLAADIPATTLRKELLRKAAVSVALEGRLRLLTREATYEQAAYEQLQALEHAVARYSSNPGSV